MMIHHHAERPDRWTEIRFRSRPDFTRRGRSPAKHQRFLSSFRWWRAAIERRDEKEPEPRTYGERGQSGPKSP